MRQSEIKRKTKETDICFKINLDGKGEAQIKTELGFFQHMLNTLARFSQIDIEASIKGDLEVDQHHSVEDSGIVFGEAFKQALGDKKGINRNGFSIYPMDESLVLVALDLCGRAHLEMDINFSNPLIGEFQADLFYDFFLAFVQSSGTTLHIKELSGRSDHHKIEAAFKALGKALKDAVAIDQKNSDQILSTKGTI